ncbi:fumarylacetoacetate hydrolase family protein [Aquibacillus sediminis]|uniref:fumarylacetoacetate hydrolase family protein n=1 Tax=Aquibacillus sediminis TaxID=2574734 RepID=UPI00110945C6|nr:fumarylacetoacetate hydrolase family protein [Aquibacillus sediminis]
MSNVTVKLCGDQLSKETTANLNDRTIELDGTIYNVDEVSFDVPTQGTVYGALLNYQGVYDQLEPSMNEDPYKAPPKGPILYIKPVNTFNRFASSVPMPEEESVLEMGAALGIVIGKTTTKVKEESALQHVAGYTVVNDVSIPHESVYRPAIKQKARDGFCPIGPWVVHRDEVKNPNQLIIRTYINGELKQENSTKNLIRSVERLIADVTDFMTLYQGDILLVGVPENAPLAQENDQIQIEIEHVGTLENTLVKEKVTVGGRK